MVLYPRSGFGGKIFVLGSILFNRESIDSRFLHIPHHMLTNYVHEDELMAFNIKYTENIYKDLKLVVDCISLQ